MRAVLLALVLFSSLTSAAQTKRIAIAFGKPLEVKWFVGPDEKQSLDMTVRPLWIGGKLREFTTGEPHDITDQLFVVRRAYRINDRLPDDDRKVPQWRWARGGWLLVNRANGRVTQIRLPEFEPYYSSASWYRDYIAYCGVSDDAERVYAIVMRLGLKKPTLRHSLGKAHAKPMPDSECESPQWQRQPPRVTFTREGVPNMTFEVRGSHAEILLEEDEPEAAATEAEDEEQP